jgi:hypothetical protein
MGAMSSSLTRIATFLGGLILVLFVFFVLVAGAFGTTTGVLSAVAIVGLVVCGSLLYGQRSHYARAAARNRPAQQAHDRAADLAADARRATAEAAKRGERYCPLDPAHPFGASPQPQPQPRQPTP